MTTTPTAALVEEAETHTTCDKCGAAIVKYSDFTGLLPTEDGMRSHTPLVCERTQELRRAEAERDELRAQVWGLICAGSNMAKAKRYYQGLWETLLDAGLKTDRKVSELTATRDLLTKQNARLRARVATLELLLRGGK